MMKFRIYQVDEDRDIMRVQFSSYEDLVKIKGHKGVDSSIYDLVYEGEFDFSDLNDAYKKFNCDKPVDYRARSMSVSDIIEVIESDTEKPGFYYVDCVGFKKVEFDPLEAEHNKETIIRVLMIEPGRKAYEKDIMSSVASLRRTIGGDLEAYYPFEDDVVIICDDEGKIKHRPANRAILDNEGDLVDIICGPFFIADAAGNYLGSLSDEMIDKYRKKFELPEKFYRDVDTGRISSMKYEPSKEIER